MKVIGYNDMTYCKFSNECKYEKDCPRALTEEVLEDAKRWWGGEDPPIAMLVNRPRCFEKKDG